MNLHLFTVRFGTVNSKIITIINNLVGHKN